MSARAVWAVIRGLDEDVPVIIGAILVYILTFVICLILQRITKVILPKVLCVFTADFFFTLAICSYPYSHGTMRQLFGHVGYFSAAVPMVTLSFLSFEGCPSPLGVFVQYLKGQESMLRLAVRVLIQTVAAFLSFRLVYLIWSMEVTLEHHERLREIACATDLNVHVALGFLVEFSGVMYDTWLGQQQLVKSQTLDLLIKIMNGCLLVCGGVHLTGMYLHPAMASGMSWACAGTSTVEHIFVYWGGSFLGCYAGLWLHSVLHLPPAAAAAAAAPQAKKGKKEEKTVPSKKAVLRNNNDVLYVYHRKKAKVQRREN